MSAAEKALCQIVTLCRNNDNMNCRELRFFAIALEGLGASAGQQRREIEAAIQMKRDRIEARRAAEGVSDANP